ncbi:MAG: hypothetical protein SFV15_17585 [Polyangiaceae bacterium]|nr:hypothetical protein [Polyangiaceae bacterium]
MTYTATATQTNTMTEARVRVVMQKVAANLNAFVVAGLVTAERARKWVDDLTYLQVEGQLEFFELQLAGRSFGLRYTISADGSIHQDSASGGIDVYGLAAGTPVQLFASTKLPRPQYVQAELERRGWHFTGKKLEAPESEQRAFSSNGYGLVRSKLGTWP